jgi:hypothetical protein
MVLEWKLRLPYPFLTERARARAPQIVDVARIARIAAALGETRVGVSFAHETLCVHAVTVLDGWTLCVLSTTGLPPALVAERTKKAAHVLALALADGARGGSSGPGGSGGAPAEARVAAPSRKRRS